MAGKLLPEVGARVFPALNQVRDAGRVAGVYKPLKTVGTMLRQPFDPLVHVRTYATSTIVEGVRVNKTWRTDAYVAPHTLTKPPVEWAVLYNQASHPINFATEKLRDVWGDKIKILQVVEEGKQPVGRADGVVYVRADEWNNWDVLKARLAAFSAQNASYSKAYDAGETALIPVWGPHAEEPKNAFAIRDDLKMTWVGASPECMEGLDKIEYKIRTRDLGYSTSPFIAFRELVKNEPGMSSDAYVDEIFPKFLKAYLADPSLAGSEVFLKSIYGGGGRGTRKLPNPSNEAAFKDALHAVIKEAGGRSDGLFIERRVGGPHDVMVQFEFETDAGMCTPGVRVVYFNDKNQKVLEIGLSDKEALRLVPADVYARMRQHTVDIAEGYDNRGTNEMLVILKPNGDAEWHGLEFNKRIQVENEGLNFFKYSNGKPFNTIAEQLMRSCGYPPPSTQDLAVQKEGINAHVRLISPQVSVDKMVFPMGVKVGGFILPKGFDAEVMCVPGLVDGRKDAQFGRVLYRAENWEAMCDKLSTLSREGVLHGPEQTNYLSFLNRLSENPDFRAQKLSSNKALSVMHDAPNPVGKLPAAVHQLPAVARHVVNGYRSDVSGPRPSAELLSDIKKLRQDLARKPVPETAYSRLISRLRVGEPDAYDRYYAELKVQLEVSGGGLVSVFPRDVKQASGDSESALVQQLSGEMTSKLGPQAGFVGYEIGGAQYQKALMCGFNFWHVLTHGTLPNLPSHSLTRSEFMNSLRALTPSQAEFVLSTISSHVKADYGIPQESESPWQPYNFHAGNHFSQDIITVLMLKAGMRPIPNWVWNPGFTDTQFDQWIDRQFKLFEASGKRPEIFRIKNPGQNPTWSAEGVWPMVQRIIAKFEQRYGVGNVPIIQIHTHNFDEVGHTLSDLLTLAHENDYQYLVVDVANSSKTHASASSVVKGLRYTQDQLLALEEWKVSAGLIDRLGSRFDVPIVDNPRSEWAGGTGSSDVKTAKDMGLDVRYVERAKQLGLDVLQLRGIVTPFSEWTMRFGYACWLQALTTPQAVIDHLESGGTIDRVPADVLEGLRNWKSLVNRPKIVEKLLENHGVDLFPSAGSTSDSFDPKVVQRALQHTFPDMPITLEDVAVLVAFGNPEKDLAGGVGSKSIGMTFVEQQSKGLDTTFLLSHPELAYAAEILPGTVMELGGISVTYLSKTEPDSIGNREVFFRLPGGECVGVVVPDDKALARMKGSGIALRAAVKADKSNPNHVGAPVPSILTWSLPVGTKVTSADQVVAKFEAMKMEFVVRAGAERVGKTVKFCNANGALQDNDLALEFS